MPLTMRKKRLAPYIEKGMVTFIKDNFRHLQARLREAGVQEIDGICYDLGVSSPQLDQRERGFLIKGCATRHAHESGC